MNKNKRNVKKILFCEAGVHGGSVKRLLNTISNLNRSKYAPSIMTFFNNGKAKKLLESTGVVNSETLALKSFPFEDMLIKIGPIPLPTKLGIYYFLKSIKMLIRDKPDIVYLNNTPYCHIPMIIAAKITGKRIICHMRDSIILTRSELWALKSISKIIVLSETHKKYYCDQGVPSEKINVVYNGINLREFDDSAADKINFNRINGSINIAFVGVLSDRKRQIDAIEALRLIAQDIQDIKIIFIGDGPDKSMLQNLSRSYGLEEYTEFLGMVENVAPILVCCDVGLMLSSREGMPNVILEYMAAGLPVLATDLPGVNEMVEEGVTGKIVAVGNFERLAAQLREITKKRNDWHTMGKTARRVIESGKFSTDMESIHIEMVLDNV